MQRVVIRVVNRNKGNLLHGSIPVQNKIKAKKSERQVVLNETTSEF